MLRSLISIATIIQRNLKLYPVGHDLPGIFSWRRSAVRDSAVFGLVKRTDLRPPAISTTIIESGPLQLMCLHSRTSIPRLSTFFDLESVKDDE